jgi:hypothetical protein
MSSITRRSASASPRRTRSRPRIPGFKVKPIARTPQEISPLGSIGDLEIEVGFSDPSAGIPFLSQDLGIKNPARDQQAQPAEPDTRSYHSEEELFEYEEEVEFRRREEDAQTKPEPPRTPVEEAKARPTTWRSPTMDSSRASRKEDSKIFVKRLISDKEYQEAQLATFTEEQQEQIHRQLELEARLLKEQEEQELIRLREEEIQRVKQLDQLR